MTAQFIIARTYYYNVKDYKKAIEWYEKAANQGDIKAQLELEVYIQRKKIQKKTIKKPLNGLKKANLEITLEDDVVNGKFDELNTLKAVAQNNLGNLYYNGHGVKQDKQAKRLYEKACQGAFIACENLKNFK